MNKYIVIETYDTNCCGVDVLEVYIVEAETEAEAEEKALLKSASDSITTDKEKYIRELKNDTNLSFTAYNFKDCK